MCYVQILHWRWVHNWRQRCRCANFSTIGALLLTDNLLPWLQLSMMPWTDNYLLISEVLDSEIISYLALRCTEWWLWTYTDVHIRHESYLLRQAAKLQPKPQLHFGNTIAGVVACLLFWLLCTASRQMDSSRSWGGEGRGGEGRGCPSGKNLLGVHPKFRVWNQATLRYSGSQTTDIFGPGISLKSKIPSFQCEITNKAEHNRPLQKVNPLLHISKYLK